MTTLELIFALLLGVLMVLLPYVGMHLNKPMFWEKGGFLDKLKNKKKQCLTMGATFCYTMYIMTKQEKQQELRIQQINLETDIHCLQSQIRSEKERLEEMKSETSVGEDWSSSVCILRTQKELKTTEQQLIRKQNKLTKFLKEK